MKTRRLPQLKKVKTIREIHEYRLVTNGLRVLWVQRPNSDVATSDIVYLVGSRDEARGETGIAHMLEHMLFKPTTFDKKRKRDSDSMIFEREVGVILNANTWKDRTSYFFSYPKEHIERALRIEAERMQNVLLNDAEFLPEQGNVLSEYDMRAGDEGHILETEMRGNAYHAHPYGHETIGYRADIETYTIEKLKKFYRKYYSPQNAVLIISGDFTEREIKKMVSEKFGKLKNPHESFSRAQYFEPRQEGQRRSIIEHPSSVQMLGIGIKHDAFPTTGWFEASVILDLLAGEADSILYKKLIDSGHATRIDVGLEPTREQNLGGIFITLSGKTSHEAVEEMTLETIRGLTARDIRPFLKRTIVKNLFEEASARETSLGYVDTLVEYVSADAWEHFFESEKILRNIKPNDVKQRITQLFQDSNLTIGHFKGMHNV